ncbi:MFS transporter [Acuticoccus kandeliae]|uniref:MFS transporter n=1 Tax=Acuticoccus kandeliae TaxID=2073160 RepID=UPI00196ACD41|nr:MFS transporter [Acuticoccus kandeliae]
MTRRRLLALLAFIAFVSLGLPDGLLGVSWPSIRASFGQPLDSLGLVVLLTTTGYLVSSFLCGAVLRVLRIGSLLALSTAAAATALLGFAFVPFWPALLVFALIAGLGGGAIDAGLNAYGARHFDARALNWMHAFYGLGATLGPLLVTTILSAGFAWQWAYTIAGSAQLALAIVFLLTRGLWGEEDLAERPVEHRAAPMLATLRRPLVWLGMALFFVYCGLEVATAQWSYSLLTLGRGVSETVSGLFVTLYWASLMVGRVAFGFVANRVPLVATLRIAILGTIAGALLFWLEPTQWLALTGLMVMGFLLAPIFASLISLTPNRVGLDHADSAIGFQIAAAGLGGAGLTAFVGVLARNFGLPVIGVSIVVLALLLLATFELFMRRR